MTDADQVGLISGEGDEGVHGLLADQHCHVPAFFTGTNQEITAISQEQKLAAAGGKMRQRRLKVEAVSVRTAYGLAGR
jgi:hypothetical protein